MIILHAEKDQSLKRWQDLAEESKRRLSEQQIVPGNPGTILKDLDVLFEFIGPEGISTRSRNATLPAACLAELNAKIGHPIELALKRPLLRDYPNLAGLFILLRVMDLVQAQGDRLVLSPPAMEFWRRLNPTEQYFALLEALLFQAQSSVLGGHENRQEAPEALAGVVLVLSQLSEDWHDFDQYVSIYTLGRDGVLPLYNLFALQQLGIIEIRPRTPSVEDKRYYSGGRGWHLGGARLTPWGTAVTWALLDMAQREYQEFADDELEGPTPGVGERQFEQIEDSGGIELFEVGAEQAEDEEELGPEAEYGILQPVFQPYFPEWQTVYVRPKPAPVKGAYVFKVSLTGWRGGDRGLWRRLAVPAGVSLDHLALAILGAFNFDDDHLYDFRYRDRRGRNRIYNRPYGDEGPFTTDIRVGETDLAVKDEMLFTFDYGDDWKFKVVLERIDPKLCRLHQAKVIESAGRAPKQYSTADW